MSLCMLAVDASEEISAKEQAAWQRIGISTTRVDVIEEAIELLQRRFFLFTAVNADTVDFKPLLGELRRVTAHPIYIVASNFSIEDQTEALRLGADGYVQFHENPDVNVASAMALVQRYNEHHAHDASFSPVFIFGNLILSNISRKAYLNHIEIKLTAKEFDLLLLLMKRPEQVFTYGQIYEYVWTGLTLHSEKEIIWTAIHRLREKLKNDPVVSKYIRTVRDVGYSFDPSGE